MRRFSYVANCFHSRKLSYTVSPPSPASQPAKQSSESHSSCTIGEHQKNLSRLNFGYVSAPSFVIIQFFDTSAQPDAQLISYYPRQSVPCPHLISPSPSLFLSLALDVTTPTDFVLGGCLSVCLSVSSSSTSSPFGGKVFAEKKKTTRRQVRRNFVWMWVYVGHET